MRSASSQFSMDSKILFIIPIYYRSFEKHEKEYDKRFKAFNKRKIKRWGRLFEQEYNNPLKLKMEFQTCWYSWSYTQIIKYIEFRLEQNIIKAYLYSLEAKRHRAIMNKKIFKYDGKIADVTSFEPYYNNKDIRQHIIDFINGLRKNYKRNYVDSSQLENLLPYIDFIQIRLDIFKNF